MATPEDLLPVRFVESRECAYRIVERWNRRFATSLERKNLCD